jgi:hypothetical protein
MKNFKVTKTFPISILAAECEDMIVIILEKIDTKAKNENENIAIRNDLKLVAIDGWIC